MKINSESIIGEIVAENYKTASVFKSHNIDFCCQGNRSIATVSKEDNVDEDALLSQLSEVLEQKSSGEIDFKSWPIDLLTDYIQKQHHRYIRNKAPEITTYLNRIVEVHGSAHPELYETEKLFTESVKDLLHHLEKEENLLFPYIREMVEKKSAGEQFGSPSFGSAKQLIDELDIEHDNEGVRFRAISKLTNGYQTPQDGCNTYRVTLNLLREFEDDLHRHIHLENNILFPATIEFEKENSGN